jgi:hypothetical protein
LITNDQLHELGLETPQVRWRVGRGDLIAIRPRVFRLAGTPISWEQAVLAAALSAGRGAVISHTTAAAVWNLRFSDRQTAGMHLTADRQIRMTGVTGHRIRLSSDERTFTGAIPVTTPERTVIDLAGGLSAADLGRCVDDAIRRRLVRLELLRRLTVQVAGRGGRHPPLEAVHKVLADPIPGYRPDDSDFETEMNRMWDRLGLPPAARQHRVVIDGHPYRLDRAIVEYRIGTEWDSYRFHSDPSARDYDGNRRARLVGDGWLIIPVTANSVPSLIAGAVMRAYLDRGGPAQRADVASTG